MTRVLVIHDLGTPGGRPWAVAFSGWDGPVAAPDLPGHGQAPPPVGGHLELGDIVFALVDHLAIGEGPLPIVIGVGRSGTAASLFALAGRASALVLVDGLGGPWLDVAARNRVHRDVRRRILATPEALAVPAPGRPDPRARWLPGQTNRDHVLEQLAAVPVPTLVLESPSSPTPDAEVVVVSIPDHRLLRIAAPDPDPVATAVREWVTTRSTPSPE